MARLTTTPALESTSKHSTPATDSEISDFLFEEDSDEDEEMRAARLRLASRRSLSTSANRKRRMASARGSKSKKKRMIFGAGANLETFLALENPGKVSVWEDSDEDRNVPRRKVSFQLQYPV